MLYKKINLHIALFFVLCASLSITASAQETTTDQLDLNNLPQAIKNLQQHKDVQVISKLPDMGGLHAYAAIAKQQPIAIYLSPDQKHIIIGSMLDEQGADITHAPLEQAMLTAWSKQTWQMLAQSTWIADGKDTAPRIIYMFTDPNCPFCNKFWQQARPWVDSGKVQIRHILVGMLTESSTPKAAAILSSNNPAQALFDHESNTKKIVAQNTDMVSEEIFNSLQENLALMNKFEIEGTPGIFYFDNENSLQIQRGAPLDDNLNNILGDLE